MKAGNNSNKQKHNLKQTVRLLYHQTTLQQFSQVIIIMGVYIDDNKRVILTVLTTT